MLCELLQRSLLIYLLCFPKHPRQHFFYLYFYSQYCYFHCIMCTMTIKIIESNMNHFKEFYPYIQIHFVHESKKDKEPSRTDAEHADRHFLVLHVTKSGSTIVIFFFGCRFDPSALQPAPSPSGRWICAQCYGNGWQRLGRTSGLVIHCAGHSGGGRRE